MFLRNCSSMMLQFKLSKIILSDENKGHLMTKAFNNKFSKPVDLYISLIEKFLLLCWKVIFSGRYKFLINHINLVGNLLLIDSISGGHSPSTLIGGLTINLYLKDEPVESRADHSVHSETIHGSGTEITYKCLKTYGFFFSMSQSYH